MVKKNMTPHYNQLREDVNTIVEDKSTAHINDKPAFQGFSYEWYFEKGELTK